MAYTTKANVRTASGFSNTTNITDATIDAYIADADSLIDSKIGDRYDLPLSETPELIETLSRHITVGYLYANEYGEESQDTDKGWERRLDWALGLLEEIRTGMIKLYDSNGDILSQATLYQPVFKPNDSSSDASASDSDEPRLTMNQQF